MMTVALMESMAEQRGRDLARTAARPGRRRRRRKPGVPVAVWFFAGWALGMLGG